MEIVQELRQQATADSRAGEGAGIQAGAYLLELSLDWIVHRASENIHHLLGESHVTLIDEPLGRFVQAQALHDLRNLFSRLSGTTGIARAYAVRLTDEHALFDVSFQLVRGRILLEAVASDGAFGECFGTVGGLIAGLSSSSGQTLMEAGARRMRALTGHDRVSLSCGERRAESSRGAGPALAGLSVDLPVLFAGDATESVGIFPRKDDDSSAAAALMRAPTPEDLAILSKAGVRSLLRVPFADGEFQCFSRTPRKPSFEMHAAAELFAQLFAMQLEIVRLRSAD